MFGFLSGGYQSGKTQTTDQTSNQITKRILDPTQQAAMGSLSSFGTDSILNPGKAIEPLRTGAYNKINKIYNAAPKNILESSASRGGGSGAGGITDRLLKELDIGRYAALSGAENEMAGAGLQVQQNGASILQQLLSQMFGQESTGASTSKTKTGGSWNLGFNGGN